MTRQVVVDRWMSTGYLANLSPRHKRILSGHFETATLYILRHGLEDDTNLVWAYSNIRNVYLSDNWRYYLSEDDIAYIVDQTYYHVRGCIDYVEAIKRSYLRIDAEAEGAYFLSDHIKLNLRHKYGYRGIQQMEELGFPSRA